MSSQDPTLEEAWVSALRVPDEINPVLLRETQSLYKGKAFPIFLILALASMVLASGVFLFQFTPMGSNGLDFLQVTLWFLAPIILVLVPLQAGHSMSEELRDGTGSILLMSGLTPGRIIAGKVQAGMLQMGVALGLFSPLIGLSYLLRGTDTLLIAGILLASIFGNLLATTLAVAVSAQAAILKRPVLTSLITVLGLGFFTLSFLVQLDWILLYAPIWVAEILTPAGVTIMIASYLAALILAWLIATAALTHPNENRASAFRIYHTSVLLLAICLIFIFAPTTQWWMGLMSWSLAGAALSIPFFFSASTDAPRLSPRVRAHVPGRFRVLTMLYLPGCGRGLLYSIAWSFVFCVIGVIAILQQAHFFRDVIFVLVGMLLYTLLYSALGCGIRTQLPHHISRNWITRVFVFILLTVVCLIPVLIQAPFGHMTWNYIHVANPFYTVGHAASNRIAAPLIFIGVLLAVLIFANRRVLIFSWTEVRNLASRKRDES